MNKLVDKFVKTGGEIHIKLSNPDGFKNDEQWIDADEKKYLVLPEGLCELEKRIHEIITITAPKAEGAIIHNNIAIVLDEFRTENGVAMTEDEGFEVLKFKRICSDEEYEKLTYKRADVDARVEFYKECYNNVYSIDGYELFKTKHPSVYKQFTKYLLEKKMCGCVYNGWLFDFCFEDMSEDFRKKIKELEK